MSVQYEGLWKQVTQLAEDANNSGISKANILAALLAEAKAIARSFHLDPRYNPELGGSFECYPKQELGREFDVIAHALCSGAHRQPGVPERLFDMSRHWAHDPEHMK
jgi:hypothetical protein